MLRHLSGCDIPIEAGQLIGSSVSSNQPWSTSTKRRERTMETMAPIPKSGSRLSAS